MNDYTYQFSRYAYEEGLVVTPRTIEVLRGFEFPVILKKPDSAFSIGVHKADNQGEYEEISSELFKTSDMIVVQEYISSDFDWRIGVMDEKPLLPANTIWHITIGRYITGTMRERMDSREVLIALNRKRFFPMSQVPL